MTKRAVKLNTLWKKLLIKRDDFPGNCRLRKFFGGMMISVYDFVCFVKSGEIGLQSQRMSARLESPASRE